MKKRRSLSHRSRLLQDQRRLSEQSGRDRMEDLLWEALERGDRDYAKYIRARLRATHKKSSGSENQGTGGQKSPSV